MPVDCNIVLIKKRNSALCGACLSLCKYRPVLSCEDACKAEMIMLMLFSPACRIALLSLYFLSSLAPDEPNFLSQYSMAEGTDFAQQTRAINVIDDIISELSRIICYNQSIYDDISLEPDEYAGLTLGVIDFDQTTSLTIVEPMYDQAAILIVDNDGECDSAL